MSEAAQRILGTVLSNLPGFLALKNAQLAYEVVNPQFCQFLGKGPEDIVGRTDTDLFPAEEAQLCASEGKSVIKSGMVRRIEQQLTGKSGPHWFDVTRAPMLDENGDPAGVMFTAYDVTAFKLREEAVKTAEAQITEAQQRAQTAEGQLAEAQQQAQAAGEQLTEAQQQAQAAQQALNEAQQAKAAAEQQLAELSQQAQVQATELEQVRAQSQQEIADAQAKAGEMQALVDKARAAAQQVEAQMTQRVQEAEAAKAEVETRLQQAAQAQTAAAQLAKQLVDALQ
ncbi:MAG: PAS domain-containing protein [Candidatus Hydrogenedens sp.]|nr:PAS domain-containing protein [Candidatus Hydrogenedens sp.]